MTTHTEQSGMLETVAKAEKTLSGMLKKWRGYEDSISSAIIPHEEWRLASDDHADSVRAGLYNFHADRMYWDSGLLMVKHTGFVVVLTIETEEEEDE